MSARGAIRRIGLAADERLPGRVEFATIDADAGVEYFRRSAGEFGTNLKFSGVVPDGLSYAHSILDAHLYAIHDIQLPGYCAVESDPFNTLDIITLHAGKFERDCGGISERFAGGDVFIHADPGLPSRTRLCDIRYQAVGIDLSVLTQVAATAPDRNPGPIRFTGFQPVSRAAAEHWKKSTRYFSEQLIHADVLAQSFLQGPAARMLAATALATFPNTALTEPTAQDRRDATSATVRRAIAFIDQHPDRDLNLADIAAAAHVSIRTLQLAFRRHLDTTPMAYLRGVRLDRVHRELLTGHPSEGATVTDIATRWGFHNHSRFASRYRHAYGVTPRVTLLGG